jgi:benzoyl-CoA reductase/2-hydroxyglutaryl-CoA dehydratase subunit BcrC/BadD/HgdB
MTRLERLVDDALRDPFAAACAHVQGGGRVIGYVGSDIPVELIIASNAFPFRLPSVAQGEVAAADRYLESSFAPEVGSIAQQYLEGKFDLFDALVLPRSNDSAQRLYYYQGVSGGILVCGTAGRELLRFRHGTAHRG